MTCYRASLAFNLSALLFALAALVGCTKQAPQLHILAVEPGADVDVMAQYDHKQYMLSVDRSGVPPSIAYYEPIGVDDAGKDFPAQLNGDEFSVTLPGVGTVQYEVQSVQEVRQ